MTRSRFAENRRFGDSAGQTPAADPTQVDSS